MTAAQEQLINDNYALAPYCARRYASLFRMFDTDELLSVAHTGLMAAASTYNPSKGKFTTYAFKAIFSRFLQAQNEYFRLKRHGVVVPLDDALEHSVTPDIDLAIDVNRTLKDAMLGTTENDKICFTMHYIEGRGYIEIGKVCGFSDRRAQQCALNVVRRFRMFWELDHRRESA
jgi:RNA polymerase sigma factor (sigma-70 family)